MTRSVAKYQQVVEWIKSQINDHELEVGDKLESENEIGARFGISRQTVRHALSILESEGILESRQGSGNYIMESPIDVGAARNKTVTIISTYVNAYIFPSIIQGMERILGENGCSLRIVFTHNKFQTERKILQQILDENAVDGLIVEPTKSGLPTPNKALYEEIVARKIPTVFFHSYYPEINIPHISIDDHKAGYLATQYLISQGHKKIAGIFKSDDGQGHRRYSGYVQAMLEAKVNPRESRVIWIDTEEQNNLTLSAPRILKRLESATACVCYNDTVAHDITELCENAGVHVPQRLSIVSIDNSEMAQLNVVPLTSVVHPMEKLGEKVAGNFIALMRNPKADVNYEFEPGIVIRESVVPYEGL